MTSFSQTTPALSFKDFNLLVNPTKERLLFKGGSLSSLPLEATNTSQGKSGAGGEQLRLLEKSGTLLYTERKVCVKHRKKYGNRFQKFRLVPKWPASHQKP